MFSRYQRISLSWTVSLRYCGGRMQQTFSWTITRKLYAARCFLALEHVTTQTSNICNCVKSFRPLRNSRIALHYINTVSGILFVWQLDILFLLHPELRCNFTWIYSRTKPYLVPMSRTRIKLVPFSNCITYDDYVKCGMPWNMNTLVMQAPIDCLHGVEIFKWTPFSPNKTRLRNSVTIISMEKRLP